MLEQRRKSINGKVLLLRLLKRLPKQLDFELSVFLFCHNDKTRKGKHNSNMIKFLLESIKALLVKPLLRSTQPKATVPTKIYSKEKLNASSGETKGELPQIGMLGPLRQNGNN